MFTFKKRVAPSICKNNFWLWKDFPAEWELVESFWLCTQISIMQCIVLKTASNFCNYQNSSFLSDRKLTRTHMEKFGHRIVQKFARIHVSKCCKGRFDLSLRFVGIPRSNGKSKIGCMRPLWFAVICLTYFQSVCPVYGVATCIATLPGIALLVSSVSIELVSSSASVTSVKFT